MKADPTRLFKLLSIAVGAMIFGLIGLAVFVHVASSRLDAAYLRIADDTAPSVIALESASTRLSSLQIVLRERLRVGGDHEREPRDAKILSEKEALSQSVAKYLSLPIDPGEAVTQVELTRDLVELDDLIDRILAVDEHVSPAARDAIREELDKTAGELDMQLLRAATLNADIEQEAAEVLHRVRRTLLPGAVVFETAHVIAALAAIVVAYHVTRRSQELAQEHRRVLEQKASELDAFSGRVAHDLLSPLMTVSVALGLAEQRLASPEDARLQTLLSRAGRTLVRVRQMVSDLLEFARAGAAAPPGAKVAIEPLLQHLVGDLEPEASEVGVELRLDGLSARSVRCSAGVLASVVSNLVQNALKHASLQAERLVVVRAVDDGPSVRVEVEDSGPGIPAEDQAAIFEPYVRRTDKRPGLGLGLATVKRLAESHGGRAGVTSEVGHGARFWVVLPAAS